MDFVLTQTYLGDILRIVSDALLGPDIVMLLLFIVYAVFCIGSILVEAVTEHRNFKVHMPEFLAALADSDQRSMPQVIEESGLLNRQKLALLTVFDYRTLPGDMLVALVKRLLNEEDTHYQRIINRNNIAVRVAPMLGLMGTLIPLGPGIAALGQGDVASLSSSLIIAFNTTVAGLAAAAVCLIIARIRRTWYNTYMNALESAMASMLYKIGMLQDSGAISIEKPSDHAFLYKQGLKRRGKKSAAPERDRRASERAERSKESEGSGYAFDVPSRPQDQDRLHSQGQLQPQPQPQPQPKAQSSVSVAEMADSSPFAQFVNYTPSASSQADSPQWQTTAPQAAKQPVQQAAQQPAKQSAMQPARQVQQPAMQFTQQVQPTAQQAQSNQQPVQQSVQFAQVMQPIQPLTQQAATQQSAQLTQQPGVQQALSQQAKPQGSQQQQTRGFDPTAVLNAPLTGMTSSAPATSAPTASAPQPSAPMTSAPVTSAPVASSFATNAPTTSSSVASTPAPAFAPISSFAPTSAADPAAAFNAALAGQASNQAATQRVQVANDALVVQRVIAIEQDRAARQGEGGTR